MEKWDGQVSEETHIALHECKKTHMIEEAATRIKVYGDRRAFESEQKYNRLHEMFKLLANSFYTLSEALKTEECPDCGEKNIPGDICVTCFLKEPVKR